MAAGREFTVSSGNPSMGWRVTVTANSGRRNIYDVDTPSHTMTIAPAVKSVRIESRRLSGVSDVTADATMAVAVNRCGGVLVVTADDVIEALRVVDLAGRTVAESQPGVTEAQLHIGASGVYIVEVSLAGGRREIRKVM